MTTRDTEDELRRRMMKISVDDALRAADRQAIETIVREVMGTSSESERLVVSVVRVKPDIWHVFIKEDAPDQWSVLPTGPYQPLADAIEAAIRKSGL